MLLTNRKVAIGLICWRLLNALCVQTFFNPDEYWQSVEIAHRMVYGYGYLTWEWDEGIRGILHPLLFAALYAFLKWLQLDQYPWVFLHAPTLFQALFAACTDFYTYLIAKTFFSRSSKIPLNVLLLSCLSWFHWYCSTRTFANSFETCLTLIALYYWPFSWNPHASLIKAFALGGLSCVIRPTSALTYVYLGLHILGQQKQQLCRILSCVLLITCPVILLGFVADRLFYGQWILTPWNFLKVNVIRQVALFYGTHPWHWYISQGLPFVLLTYTPLLLLSKQPFFTSTKTNESQPVVVNLSALSMWKNVIIWTLIMYSCLQHKEFRFIYPLLPICLLLSGYVYNFIPASNRKLLTAVILGPQILLAVYMTQVHQRGVVDVLQWLRLKSEIIHQDSYGVLFLMPCHSTPYTSHWHTPRIRPRFLTCEPPSSDELTNHVVDEAHRFYENPVAQTRQWLTDPQLWVDRRYLGPNMEHVDAIVLFECLLQMTDVEGVSVIQVLKEHGYQLAISFFNGHFNEDWRRQGSVQVWTLSTTVK